MTFIKKNTILLVEDNVIIAIDQARMLERHGNKVVRANSAQKAIKLMQNGGAEIDLILMDINLGNSIDGTEAAKEILKYHDVPIIFLSSHTEKEIVDKTETITNYGYVVKNSGDFVLIASIKMAFKLFTAKKKLKENEEKYYNMVSSVPGIVYRCANDEDWTMEFISDEVSKITGYPSTDFINNNIRTFTSIIHPDDVEYVDSVVQKALIEKRRFEIEYRICHFNGMIKSVHERGQGIFDNGGKLLWLDGIITDVTAIKTAEKVIQRQLKEKELLLIEVHHRIKNNINTISSTLKLKLDTTSDSESQKVLLDTITRIESMGVIYDKLLKTNDYHNISVNNYLDDLIEAIVSIFPENDNIILIKEIDDFNLDVRILFPIGAIVNELITNSMKYGFVNNRLGNLNISLSKDNNEIKLVVQDNGVGYPENFDLENSMSFGLMIVKMLTEQLNGTLSITNSNGVSNVIQFKI